MLDASGLAYLLVLVGPGFVAMQLRAWTSEGYRISDAQRITWSVLVALPIFFGLHGLLRHVPWKAGKLASPQDLLASPFSAPIQFIVALYAIAALLGYVVGRLLDSEFFNDWLIKIRLDPTRHRDVWKAAFRDQQVVSMQLHDGTLFYGWVEENSSGSDERGRFVRLAKAWRRRPGDRVWKKLPSDNFVLIAADAIRFIRFKPYVPGADAPDSAAGPE